LSWHHGSWRVSTRVDGFDNEDRDGTAEPDQESGWALTTAVFWQPRPIVRLGAEYLVVRAQRPAAAFSGADPDTDARRALLELRLVF
jgi:phosphate-selective porin